MRRFIVAALAFVTPQANAQTGGWEALPQIERAAATKSLPDWVSGIQGALQEHQSLDVLIEFRSAATGDLPTPETARAQSGERLAAQTYAANVRNGVAAAQTPLSAEFAAAGIEVIKSYIYQPIIHARITQKHIDFLATHGEVASVHLNAERKVEESTDVTPTDDIHKPQLYLTTVQTGASKAWAKGFRGQGYTVAILDSGILATHDMFKNKIIAEGCFSTASTGAESLCPGGVAATSGPGTASLCVGGSSICDHGSHVAGIAAGNNAGTVTVKQGVAPDAKIIPVQVFRRIRNTIVCDGLSSCLTSTDADQLAALDWLISIGPTYKLAAVNLSLGSATGDTTYCDSNEILTRGVNTLRAMGILTVISAGNSGFVGRVGSPGCIKRAVTVSSTVIANNAPNTSHNHAAIVDLLAPGTLIESALVTTTTSYGFKSGTSMAAPHVAGAFAVLKSKLPTATADQLEYALKASGIATSASTWTWTTPRIEIDLALNVLGQDPPPPGVVLPGFMAGAYTAGTSYLRLVNPTTSTGIVSATLVQDSPRKVLGTYDISLPGRSAIQKEVRELEAALGQVGEKDSGISIYLDSSFSGFAQNVLWNSGSRSFTNLTVCKATIPDPNTFLSGVHTSRLGSNPSVIRLHNQTGATTGAIFDLYNANTGAVIGVLGTQTVAPNTSLTLTADAALNALNFTPTGTDYHVNFVLRSGFTGVIAHLVNNTEAGFAVDMTGKCPI